jgi:hypothetical protein
VSLLLLLLLLLLVVVVHLSVHACCKLLLSVPLTHSVRVLRRTIDCRVAAPTSTYSGVLDVDTIIDVGKA